MRPIEPGGIGDCPTCLSADEASIVSAALAEFRSRDGRLGDRCRACLEDVAASSAGMNAGIELDTVEASRLVRLIFDTAMEAPGIARGWAGEYVRIGKRLDTQHEIDWAQVDGSGGAFVAPGPIDPRSSNPDSFALLPSVTTDPLPTWGAAIAPLNPPPTTTGRVSPPALDRSASRRRPALIAAAGVLVVAAAFVGGLIAASDSSDGDRVEAARPPTTEAAITTEWPSTALTDATTAPSTPASAEGLFLRYLQDTGAMTELQRMLVLSPGQSWDEAFLTLGLGVCGQLADGVTDEQLADFILGQIVDVTGVSGPDSPGVAGEEAVGQLVQSSRQFLCPAVKRPSPATTERSTSTTTRRTTPTTTRRTTSTTVPPPTAVVGTGHNPCAQAVCKIYLRDTPTPDLSQPEDRYYLHGDPIPIVCSTTGAFVRDGDTGESSARWFRTETGLYVSALYVRVDGATPTC